MRGEGVGVRKIGAVRLMLSFGRIDDGDVEVFKASFHESVEFVDAKTVVTLTSVTVVFALPDTNRRHDETRNPPNDDI